ncbi:hypothetical protein H6P81_018880 [Aristolochia fimbriata]|uniref:Chalcone-flavanone isomerase n=1 Tax=Aristolochia fimbriata TaxID=158543 RepID=A0AAV7E5F9_ARIFI|nr:hypothetical protein H6P81_018880 [Aristolochia fimbriata]
METPSSMRRVTRSQTSAASKNIPLSSKGKKDETEMVLPRSSRKGKSDRYALVDITNDSPIGGLALENLDDTPSSVAKNSARPKQTPGSGEALLRGQVKTLLQKIEEGTEVMKVPFEQRPFPRFQGLMDSPALGVLAPTPTNTPQVENFPNSVEAEIKQDSSSIISEVSHDDEDLKNEEGLDSTGSPITRALLFDSPGKSDGSSVFSSEVTYEISSKSIDEDNSSVWSVQANASSREDEEDENEVSKREYEEEDDDDDDDDDYDGGVIDQLCQGLSKICVEEKGALEFTGRHTRFVYNSDGEIEGEEEVAPAVSPSVLRLKGLPTPAGKHLRFNEDEVEDQ